MKKIILNNGKEIDVLEANNCSFSVKTTVTEMANIFSLLTEENLETLTIKDSDTITALLTNKCRSSVTYTGDVAYFYLGDVDVTAKKIKELEDTIDTLILSNMGILEQEESEE